MLDLPRFLVRALAAHDHDKIDSDGADPPSGVSLQGDIVTVYSGGCAVLGSGGAAGAGLTIELRLPFDAVRR